MSVLEMKDISYSYEKSRKILTAVNAVFETGKMYAILGPSGSGKTTLLSLLGDLIPRRKVKSFLMERIFQSMDLNITGVIIFRSYSKTTILLTI